MNFQTCKHARIGLILKNVVAPKAVGSGLPPVFCFFNASSPRAEDKYFRDERCDDLLAH
jgi:hypothetical protein